MFLEGSSFTIYSTDVTNLGTLRVIGADWVILKGFQVLAAFLVGGQGFLGGMISLAGGAI